MNPVEEHPLNILLEQASDDERKKQIYAQKALRTLEGDIREAVEKRNVSTASIVMSEQAKVESATVQKKESSGLWKKLLLVFFSFFLVIVGAGGCYYLYLKSPLAPSAPVAPKPVAIPSIVAADSQKTLDLTGMGSGAASTAVENALSNISNGNGSILQIVPIKKESSSEENVVSASDFLTMVDLPAPDILFRSLNEQWQLGTYNDNGSAAPFIILTDNFFQNAYAGMIAWENTLPDNFADIFGYADKAKENETVGTSTVTSFFTIQGSFKDGVIDNKDVRAFVEPNGVLLVLYSFVDNNTVVITTDENALAKIIDLLEKETYVR